MTLNLSAVGKTTAELVHTYTWKDVVLYALSIGAKRDGELAYLFEGEGPKVFPSYAVVPAFIANAALFDAIGGNMLGVVHGGQAIRLHKPFAPAGTLKTVGKVAGVYDLKRMATTIVTTETRDEKGELVCETEWSIIYRLDGGFDGPPPPKRDEAKAPARPCDWSFEESTSKEQAALYRLNGDLNPLHIDPKIGESAGFGHPILHGLCTYGYVCRAVIANECAGDPSKLKYLSGQFRKPVWPGDTLITEGWREDGRIVLRVSAKERPGDYVFSGGYATLG
ncbi:MAG: MaoC family dehydratase N-terminal domain-containing protein [Sandaracinaceae bacterium]|nr:MaoC family dehydratase N-terminal domain-containing protein [Sandaracinaceae bacterium]